MTSRIALLGDVCEIAMGQAPKGDTYNETGDGVPLIAGASDFGDFFPEPSKFTSSPTKVSRCGDIILCIRATIGDRNWANGEYCLGRGVAGLRPVNGSLDSKYLWHWLDHASPALKSKGRGATFLQVSKKDIASLRIPLPPLEEQKRIARILDEADALRAKRRESIEQLDALLQSIFLDMFGDPVTNPKGWDCTRLGAIIVDGPQNGLYRPARYYGSGTRILRIDGFYDGIMSSESSFRRVELSERDVQKYRLREGDIVVNRVNSREYLGKSALIPALSEDVVYESNMMRFRVDHALFHPRFVVQCLQQRALKNQILHASKDAVNQSSINQTDVKNLAFYAPPRKDQQRFVDCVNIIDTLHRDMEMHRSELDTLFSSLQSRAFNGEL